MDDSAQPATQVILLWDLPLRLFHWFLVGLFVLSWVSAKMQWTDCHLYSGLCLLTLLLFRLLWGFWGSSSAQFARFVRGPHEVWSYLRRHFGRTSMSYQSTVGHNPLGGISVLVMLLCLLIQAATGLGANDDIMVEGPLYRYITKELSDQLTSIHHFNFNVLLILVAMHISAIFYYWIVCSDNLIKPMLYGYRRIAVDKIPAQWRTRGLMWALPLLIVCGLIVWLLVRRW